MVVEPGSVPSAVDPPVALTRRIRVSPLLAVGSGNVGGLLLGLVSGVVAARVLGPTLRGEFVATQAWASMVAVVLTLGVTQAVVTYHGEDKDLAGPLLLQAGLAIAVGIGLFVALSATGAEPWLTTAGVAGGAMLTVAGLVSSNSAGLAQRKGRMVGAFQQVRLLPQAIGVMAVLVLWGTGNRDPNTWLLVVGLALLAPALLLYVGLLGGAGALKKMPTLRAPRQLVRGASSAFVIVVGAQLIYRLDSLLVAAYLPTYKVALYAVAVTAGTACAAIGQAVGMLMFSRMRGIDDRRHQRTIVQRSVVRALAVTSAVSLPLAAIAPYAVRLVYGKAFIHAAGPTRVLVLAAVPLAADYLLLHALLSIRASRSAFHVQLLAGALTVGLLAVTIPTENLTLIALVSLGVYSASAICLFVAVMRRTAGDGNRAPAI